MRYFMFFIVIILLSLVTSCSHIPMEVDQVSEYCLSVSDYDKTICLETPFDSLYPMLYIDKNPLEMRNKKFTGLKLYIMMVVEKKESYITFSNVNYSIKVNTKKLDTECINIQDMYYIISKREYLTTSTIVLNNDGTFEPNDEEKTLNEDYNDYGEYGEYDEEP